MSLWWAGRGADLILKYEWRPNLRSHPASLSPRFSPPLCLAPKPIYIVHAKSLPFPGLQFRCPRNGRQFSHGQGDSFIYKLKDNGIGMGLVAFVLTQTSKGAANFRLSFFTAYPVGTFYAFARF